MQVRIVMQVRVVLLLWDQPRASIITGVYMQELRCFFSPLPCCKRNSFSWLLVHHGITIAHSRTSAFFLYKRFFFIYRNALLSLFRCIQTTPPILCCCGIELFLYFCFFLGVGRREKSLKTRKKEKRGK